MKRVNCHFFYDLGSKIAPLRNFTEATVNSVENQLIMYFAKIALEHIQSHTIIKFKNCLEISKEIINYINLCLYKDGNFVEANPLLSLGFGAGMIGSKIREFETLITNEISFLDIYSVSEVRAYNISKIINDFTQTLSPDVAKSLSTKAINDWQEAGKCLAFELSTACGFHLLRTIETVITDYYKSLSSGKDLLEILKEKDRSWGNFINKLKEAKASDNVIAVLEQLKVLHRNPLMHPEDTLTKDEAHTLVGMVISCIESIYKDMENRKGEVIQLPFPTSNIKN